MGTRLWLVAVLGAILAGPMGCGTTHPLRLEVDPASYYTHGAYVGTEGNVKLFVESVVYTEKQKSAIHVALAILNERRQPIRFDVASNRLSIGTRTLYAEGSQTYTIQPMTIERMKLEFRTHMDRGAIDTGTVHVEGVEVGSAETRIAFNVQFRRRRTAEELEE